jgi:predicted metal-dependent HD superfamily phosphohydrolase
MNLLKDTFIQLVSQYTADSLLVNQLWAELEENYTGKKRYYHTLQHFEHLLKLLTEIKPQVNNWNAILFSMFYHDIIYNGLKTTNEEKSAAYAENRMQQISVPQTTIEIVVNQILATKKHAVSADNDTNFFTDADLAILGLEWEQYAQYYKQVRKEYALFPDLIYVPGRKKVLQHFLQMARIYKTDHFFTKFEKQAKQNLQKELSEL